MLGARTDRVRLHCWITRRLLVTGCVNKSAGHPVKFDAPDEVIARRARFGTDECVTAREQVEQAALSGVGRAGQDHAEGAVAEGSLLQACLQPVQLVSYGI